MYHISSAYSQALTGEAEKVGLEEGEKEMLVGGSLY